MIRYVLFDVSGTLLYKPALYSNYLETLACYGHHVKLEDLRIKHKVVAELTKVPDRTDSNFYREFNANILYLLGILPTDELLAKIFAKCTYLPWEKFEDTAILGRVQLPVGVLSNFNSTLRSKLDEHFGQIFSDILVSEEVGLSKPSVEFYMKAVAKLKLAPEDILYIGDSMKLDVEPAIKVGLKALLIDRNSFYTESPILINNLSQIKKFL